jgi:hypothetical protein
VKKPTYNKKNIGGSTSTNGTYKINIEDDSKIATIKETFFL